MRLWATLPLAIAIVGCAHNETGHIDYRVADPPGVAAERTSGDPPTRLPNGLCSDEVKQACDLIVPARVVRRYMPPQAEGWGALKAKDVFSIEIEQGNVGNNIAEGHFLSEQFGKHAEIAILANVFEFASTPDDAAKKRFIENAAMSDDPSDVELKLIYFGKGIEKRQMFNFSNIPLMKRSEYKGGSIGIQIVVMEVDARSGPFSSLLQTLARFGQQLAPGPNEAKDLIFDLGESLLAGGSKDDKLFDYRFVLSAEGSDPRATQATFAPGRYVLRRTESIKDDVGWDKLRLDYNTGRLLKYHDQPGTSTKPAGTGIWSEYREDLYLTLNVRKYPEGTAPEFYEPQNWTEFRKALQLAADSSATNVGKLTEDVAAMLQDRRSQDWGARLSRNWVTVQNRLEIYGSRYSKDGFAGLQREDCATLAELQRRHDLVKREAETALRDFVALYQQAIAATIRNADGTEKKNGDKPMPEFSGTDREAVVSDLAPFFMPWNVTEADDKAFTGAAAFEKAFIAKDAPLSLSVAARTAAEKKNAGPKTCEMLMAR